MIACVRLGFLAAKDGSMTALAVRACDMEKIRIATYLRTILTGWVPLAEVVKSLPLRLFLYFRT